MALVLFCEVTVGSYVFRQVNAADVKRSWRELIDTATIKLPGLKFQLDKLIQPGDPVTIKLGYVGVFEAEEFKGFVKRVIPGTPYEIECEGFGYLLRKVNLKKTWENTTLKEIVSYIVDEVNAKFPKAITQSLNIPEVQFDTFRLNNVNGAVALQKLKDEYGLAAYFRINELYCGLAYGQNFGEVKYSLAWSGRIVQNVAGESLTWRDAEDVKVKVKAIGILPNNTKLEAEVGDKDEGEQRTLFFYNIKTVAELKQLAGEEIKKLKFSGLEGSLNTLGKPFAEPMMTAVLFDPEFDNKRNGNYVIDSVITSFGEDGYKRNVELGIRVDG